MTTGRYAVDAGGSGTAVRAFGGGWQLPSINPCSDGAAAADAALADLLGSIAADVRGRQLAGARVWLAAASAGHDRPETERARLAAAVRDVPVPLAITLCNDVDALVLACLAEAGTVVAVCGTGSGVVAASPAAGVVRVGGEEYLAGDQGSAYDLGRAALRAAARALDGRGPATALTGELAGAGGCPVPELGRRLAGLPHAKRAVAALAPAVTRCWLAGDAVAGALVRAAAAELALAVRVAAAELALPPGWRFVAAGGVFRGCPEFYRLVGDLLPATAGERLLVAEPARELARAMARPGWARDWPAWAGRLCGQLDHRPAVCHAG